MQILVIFFLGFFSGCVAGWIFTHRETIGTLRVDTSEHGEDPVIFMEFEHAPEQLKDGDRFEIVVSIKSYLAQDSQGL